MLVSLNGCFVLELVKPRVQFRILSFREVTVWMGIRVIQELIVVCAPTFTSFGLIRFALWVAFSLSPDPSISGLRMFNSLSATHSSGRIVPHASRLIRSRSSPTASWRQGIPSLYVVTLTQTYPFDSPL